MLPRVSVALLAFLMPSRRGVRCRLPVLLPLPSLSGYPGVMSIPLVRMSGCELDGLIPLPLAACSALAILTACAVAPGLDDC